MQFLIDITLALFYLVAFLIVCAWSWRFWKMYINQKFLNQYQKDCLLLEIKLPRDIFKSPLAMEVALTALLQNSGASTWYDRNVKGKLLHYFSLEIASLEGVVHFYIRTHKNFRPLIETNLYAQYPGIEITQADDYTALIRYHHLSKDVITWGTLYPLAKAWKPTDKNGDTYKDKKGEDYTMKADFLPIKTYVDYGLDKDPKEEYKTDPITPLLEFLGSLGRGQYAWYQIMVQDDSRYNGTVFPKGYVNKQSHTHMSLTDMANARKKQIRTSHILKKGDKVFDDYGNPKMIPTGEKDTDGNPILVQASYNFDINKPKEVSKGEISLTVEEKEEIELINRKLSKPTVRAIVRLVFIAKSEFRRIDFVPNVISIMRHFNHGGNSVGNGFSLKPADSYDYPWQNTMQRRLPWRHEEMFEAFVEREGFYPHAGEGTTWEDITFWPYSMGARKKYRMIFDAIFHPFSHPHADIITLNLEELATIWHFPGAVAGTPTLPRIDSNKGVAPVNLPQ